MKIALAGATGRTGARVLDLALRQGHEVTALVRRPEAVAPRPGLVVVAAQVTERAPKLSETLRGQQVVVSALGSRLLGPGSDIKIMEAAHRTLVAAAEAAGVPRFTSMVAYGTGDTTAHAPAAVRLLGRTVLRKDFADVDRAVEVLRGCSLRWSAVHFGALTDTGPTGRWTSSRSLSRPARFRISRDDVAEALMAVSAADEGPGSVVLSGGPS